VTPHIPERLIILVTHLTVKLINLLATYQCLAGWAYKGSAVVVEVPVLVSNESPEVVDIVDVVVGGLEKDRRDGNRERDKIFVEGLSIDGEEEHLGCCKC
jgi:hypothetical protein